jgi:hypothetical protein
LLDAVALVLGPFALHARGDAAGEVGVLLRGRNFGHDHAAAGQDAVGVGEIEAGVFLRDAVLFGELVGQRDGLWDPFGLGVGAGGFVVVDPAVVGPGGDEGGGMDGARGCWRVRSADISVGHQRLGAGGAAIAGRAPSEANDSTAMNGGSHMMRL